MNKLLQLFTALALLLSTHLCQAETVALAGARLIDGVSDRASDDAVILVENGSIKAIGDRSIISAGVPVIELNGLTLLPGLVDLHNHPSMWSDDYQLGHLQTSSAYKALMSMAAVQQYLLNGWTSVRVPGDADVFYANQDVRKAINEGAFTGPRLSGAGHYLSITGGGGDLNFISHEQPVIADGLIVDGPDEVRKAVRTEIKYGSDWIKLLVTGAYQAVNDDPRQVAFSMEELTAAVEEANRQGIPVAAHAHADAGIAMAVKAGARSIEHGTFISDETIELMAERGTYLVPTIYIGDYYGTGEEHELRAQDKNTDYFLNERPLFLERIGRAHKAGVKIGVGTDFGGVNGQQSLMVRELATLVEAGMTAMEAIQAATRVGAEALMWDDRIGTLEVGKLADIIAVPGDPLQDLSLMEQVEFVMIGGRIVKQPGQVPDLNPSRQVQFP